MKKWVLIIIHDRAIDLFKSFDTFEEAQKEMENDFLSCIDPEEFREACDKNGGSYSEDWALEEGCAWISGRDNIDWFIEAVA